MGLIRFIQDHNRNAELRQLRELKQQELGKNTGWVCDVCKTPCVYGQKICNKCGKRFKWDTYICDNCNTRYVHGQRFCNNCGKQFYWEDFACAECDTPCFHGQKFCNNCGTELVWDE